MRITAGVDKISISDGEVEAVVVFVVVEAWAGIVGAVAAVVVVPGVDVLGVVDVGVVGDPAVGADEADVEEAGGGVGGPVKVTDAALAVIGSCGTVSRMSTE